MAIKLWQRKHGHLGPPDELIHAEPESRHFPVPFRNRIVRWSVDCFRQRFPPAPYADDSPEEIRGALNSLCHQLAEAYGRPLLVPIGDLPGPVASTSDYEAERQIPAHLARCTDFEALDFIDGVFQLLAQTSEGYAGTDHRVAINATSRLNAVCEEEGVGYRWADGELIRFDDPVAHAEAVKPAMQLLSAGQFGHANAEFRRALDAEFCREPRKSDERRPRRARPGGSPRTGRARRGSRRSPRALCIDHQRVVHRFHRSRPELTPSDAGVMHDRLPSPF
jgi:hypothetical protein